MDLSKLPKFSQSPAPPNNEEAASTPGQSELPTAGSPPRIPASDDPGRRSAEYSSALPRRDDGPGVGAEVWISAIIGLIFILMGFNFAKYSACVLTGQTYHTGVTWGEGGTNTGEVPYTQLYGHVFWNDSAMFLFGLALLMEAAVLLAIGMNTRFQRPLVVIGFLIAFVATAYNLVVAAILFNANITPLMSLLAVAFGGYTAMYLWNLMKVLAPIPPAPR